MKRAALFFFFFLFFLLFVSSSLAAGNLGTNLGGVNYWDGIVPFNNIVKQGGEWIGAKPLATDKNGWPTKLSAPVSMAIAEVQYPAGQYTVRWKGSGAFSVGGKEFSGKDGQGTAQLDGSSLVLLVISSTSSRDHLRDIEVLVPGALPGEAFRSRYLLSLQPYNVVRFMDWQKTNGTFSDPAPRLSCKSATRANSISQGRRKGAAVYWMVRLANRLGADPWFTVPHKADSSWIRCHARTVARLLRKDLVPRYEFSNETWNPAFEQFFHLRDAGEAHGLGSGDSYLGLQQEVARRHNRMVSLVSPAMKKSGRQFVRVLSGQAANPWVLEQRLQGAAAKTDEIAIAPYMHLQGLDAFDPSDGPAIVSMSKFQVINSLRASLAGEVGFWIEGHLQLASSYNKKLVAYEGGQHLAGDSANSEMTDLFVGANRSQDMGMLYGQYLALWREMTGGALFMHFTDSGPYSKYGAWGALESPDQDFSFSPKYQALLAYSAG